MEETFCFTKNVAPKILCCTSSNVLDLKVDITLHCLRVEGHGKHVTDHWASLP